MARGRWISVSSARSPCCNHIHCQTLELVLPPPFALPRPLCYVKTMTTAILTTLCLAAALLFWPRLSNAPLWRATITPLASIIGSGFLVLGPILHSSFGLYAPLAMAALALLAYLFGTAVRFNIQRLASEQPRPILANRVEVLASWALTFAYIVSVAYYLNLFGAFAVSLTPLNTPLNAQLAATVVFCAILLIGLTKGFSALERVEQISVGIKLAIIAGLLAGMAVYFADKVSTGALVFSPATVSGWSALTLGFGLLITVQGFETSRYLGDAYDAPTRIHSMKLAQWVSTAIYLIYICLLAYVFTPVNGPISETEIIDMMVLVAPILPLLLVAAALAAQLSAAIADTSGSGGLAVELTKGKIGEKQAYAVLVAIGLVLTWVADIFQIISYASRAFAIYYALQAAIAALSCAHPTRKTLFWVLALTGLLAAIFGSAIEGG